MTTPLWQAGHLYMPGDLVQPVQVAATPASALTNPNFETGVITGWTVTQTGGTGTATVATDRKYSGTYAGRWQGATGTGHSGGVEAVWENATSAQVSVGQSVTALMFFALDDTSNSQNQAQVRLRWYAADGTTIVRTDSGTLIHGDGTGWKSSTVTGAAPAGATHVRLAAWTTANSHGGVRLDAASWNHVSPPSTYGLIYKAVQTGPGTSASSEPTWPTTLGVQVIDNTVTWEAVNTNRVVWEASPILLTDGTEPTWPTTPGDFVSDGTVSWECVSRRIEDANCPNTKVVAILSSKVFAIDKDIVRFSATANPLDWTSERDAGFLPTGLQQANANDMAVLAPYRGNLAAFNASSFQMWQTDPDPEAMAQLDQMEGIGSTSYKAAQPVGNDLLFLTKLGVRSVSIAAGADNLAAGDVGMPIDPLVQAVMTADQTLVPLATYYPSAGQYWLTFKAAPVLTAISLTGNLPDGTVGDAISYGYTTHGGVQPYTYTLDSGALPTGLSLNSEGVVSGTMTAAGTFAWVVRVTSSDGLTDTLVDGAAVGRRYYMAVGASGKIYTAPDLPNTWTAQTSGTTQELRAITQGASNLIVCGGSSAPVLLYSTDRTTWHVATVPAAITGNLYGIASSGTSVVAASNPTGTTDGKLARSTDDGLTWTAIAGPSGCGPLTGIHYADGKYVGCSTLGKIIVSTDDGLTWAKYNVGTGFLAITYHAASALWMVVGNSAETKTATDPAGTWTARSTGGGANYSFLSVAPGLSAGHFVAGSNGTSSFTGVYRTTDSGATWTRVYATSVQVRGTATINGRLVSVTEESSALDSADETTWTSHTIVATFAMNAIAEGLLAT